MVLNRRVPLTGMTVEVPGHDGHLGKGVDAPCNKLDGPVLVVGVYVHKIDGIVPHVK